ncbi:MAG: arginine--tRNA ligase [Bacteroidetes bacterium]|nr:arginine--tRNA ligase [Bacteroidota bacterium]
MKVREILQNATQKFLQDGFGVALNASEIQIQETRKDFEGDYTVVIFPLAKHTKKNPTETAKLLGDYLNHNIEFIQSFEIVQGFLNLKFTDSFWMEFLEHSTHGVHWEAVAKPLNIMVEYSSPNTNKPLHLGHIRNNLLGYSVAEILKAKGHHVIKSSLVNDRGIHICKSMLAWIKFGEDSTPELEGLKGDHFVGKYYVEFDKHYKKQIEELVAGGMDKAMAEKEAPLIKEAQDLLLRWEKGEPEVLKIWGLMNGWVYEGFEQTYSDLGVDFDKFYYESDTYLLGKTIVDEGLEKGVFYRKEDGSVWIDLSDEGLDEKLVLRANGTSVYITQDLGTVQKRFEEYKLDKLIYVVGNEQEYHFKVLKLISKKLGSPWANQLQHLSYGMVDLPSGKMKSREGTVVDADDLIKEMIETAEASTKELGKTDEMDAAEQTALSRKIGMAALKFFLLKVDPTKRMLFNPEQSIDFHGFTGPFVQYTYARIKSILRRHKQDEPDDIIKLSLVELRLSHEEKDIVKLLYTIDEMISEAEHNLSPAVVANYSYELAKAYNKFYQEHSVLKELVPSIKNLRLLICKLTAETIQKTMLLIGIEMPERM